jgi:hypothetical protein
MTQPTIPACGGTPALNPGIYYDPAALSALTTGCDVTLNPGVYFLDFPSSATPWNISGTITATCDGTGQGAQIVFANQSKLNLGATGTLNDLCGRKANASSTTPNITLYGLNRDAGTPAGPFTTTLRPATATDTGTTQYYSGATLTKATPAASAAYPQDSPASNATATVAASAKTSELTLSSFAPSSGPALQQNAIVSNVIVKVAHNETTNTNFTGKVPKLMWGSCSINLTPQQNATSTLWTSGNLWATGTGLSSCAGFTPTAAMSVVWDVTTTTATSQAIQLDGAQVDVTWTDPGIPKLAGCTVTVGGCSIIDSTGGRLRLNDVVYLPTAKLAGAFATDDAYPISSLIARSLDVNDNPNSSGGVQFGTLTPTPVLGAVLFQASIANAPWTDAIATYDPKSTPTLKADISTWVPRH